MMDDNNKNNNIFQVLQFMGFQISNIRSRATKEPRNPAKTTPHTPTDFTKTVILSFMARRGGLRGSSQYKNKGLSHFIG